MTVGELKELLEEYKVPDDAEIYTGLDSDDVLDLAGRVRFYEGENELHISRN